MKKLIIIRKGGNMKMSAAQVFKNLIYIRCYSVISSFHKLGLEEITNIFLEISDLCKIINESKMYHLLEKEEYNCLKKEIHFALQLIVDISDLHPKNPREIFFLSQILLDKWVDTSCRLNY